MLVYLRFHRETEVALAAVQHVILLKIPWVIFSGWPCSQVFKQGSSLRPHPAPSWLTPACLSPPFLFLLSLQGLTSFYHVASWSLLSPALSLGFLHRIIQTSPSYPLTEPVSLPATVPRFWVHDFYTLLDSSAGDIKVNKRSCRLHKLSFSVGRPTIHLLKMENKLVLTSTLRAQWQTYL